MEFRKKEHQEKNLEKFVFCPQHFADVALKDQTPNTLQFCRHDSLVG